MISFPYARLHGTGARDTKVSQARRKRAIFEQFFVGEFANYASYCNWLSHRKLSGFNLFETRRELARRKERGL